MGEARIAAPKVTVAFGPSVTGPPPPLAEPDASQLAQIADGEVSVAEMEAALLATVACVQDRGFYADLISFEGGDGWHLESGGATAEEADRADRAMQECADRFLNLAAEMYLENRRPSAAEVAASKAAIVDCLVARGHPVEGLELREVLVQGLAPLSDVAACEQEVEAQDVEE